MPGVGYRTKMRSRSGVRIGCRGGADNRGKVAGHVALVSEACLSGSGSKRRSLSKKLLHLSHLQADMVGVWGHSRVLLEQVYRLASTQADNRCKRFKTNICFNMCVKVINDPCSPTIIVPILGVQVGYICGKYPYHVCQCGQGSIAGKG